MLDKLLPAERPLNMRRQEQQQLEFTRGPADICPIYGNPAVIGINLQISGMADMIRLD
ncbi:hypothetical protein D3C81_2269350 [compost metagenome]